MSSNAKEALVLEQRHQAALEICNVLSFPAQLIGLKDSTYQNGKEAKKALWEKCVIPVLDKLKDGYNRWLAPQFGEVTLDYDLEHIDAIQEDRLMRGKAIKEFAGAITINQALTMAGMDPYEWMAPPTNMEEFREQMFVAFTQGVANNNDSSSEETQKFNDWYEGE